MSFPDLSSPDRLVGRQVLYYKTLGSTNTRCHELALAGAENGTAVIAGTQTAGRGRRGRSFQSLADKGLYLSVLLRPQCASMEELSRLTPWTAVAVCRALEELTSLRFTVKWVNDILLAGKKLCGILTELSYVEAGVLDYAVVGIGVDLNQTPEDFGPELSSIATSLGQHMTAPPSAAQTARALLSHLDQMWRDFPTAQAEYLMEYRRRCDFLGRPILFQHKGQLVQGTALNVNEDFSLQVRLPDGDETALTAGEVSVCL